MLALLRENFLQLLVNESYTTLEIEALKEACIDYPPELAQIATDAPFTGRGLWKLHVRIPSTKLNLAKLADGEVLHNYGPIGAIFDDAGSADFALHRMHTRNVCSNDRARTCTVSVDCLNGGTCQLGVPDIEVKVLTAGGSLAPIEVAASGMDLISVEYDITQTGWWARVRYDNTVPNTINVLYLPHITAPVDNEEFATFRHDEFSCMPLGTGEFQQRRKNTVCCLQTLFDDYTTTTGFEAYINDTSRALGQALPICAGDNTFPSDTTQTLLDGSLDFVTGSFARMSRSYARLDTVATRGYQDIIVFLAEEDMRDFAGIESAAVGGYRLRFFLGMAHLQPLPSTHLHASFSHTEVTTEITENYVFTTSSATEFTFVQHINVDLIQVRNESAGEVSPSYQRFARVGISVPPGTSADEVHGIVPFDSARVSVGYTQDTALEAGAYYPCLDIDRAPIRAMLDSQEWCALQDPLCATLGPTEVTAGGQVYFIFPIRSDAWDRVTMDETAFFKPSLYLDFMLSTRDAGGTRVMTRVETRTEITAAGIASMCDERQLQGTLGDILSIDMFMGLTPDKESMADTLLQSRDLTRQGPEARHFERDTSSVASNVLTLLVKGDPAVFEQSYAQNYALEVEDMITMHFLDAGLRTQVEALMSSGQAFRKEVDPSSYTSMRIVPTDALLNLCPLQATRNVQGCIMRKEVEARLLDFTTQAIVGISPSEDGANANDIQEGAGDWLQNLLGDSTFVDNLGKDHSRTFATEFSLNDRFRKGFMINPTIPWRQAQMTAAGAATSLDLAQDAISVVLVTMDKNTEAGLAPTVELSLPATLQVPADELLSNVALQLATEASYADAAGVAPESVSIDLDSVTSNAATRRRRHLLQAPETASCSFDMKIAIDVQDEEVAMAKANEIRREAQEPESKFTKKLVRSVNRRVRAVAKSMPPVKTLAAIIPPDVEIKPPVNTEKCYDDTSFSTEINNAALDSIPDMISAANGAHKLKTYFSCTRRWLRIYDVQNDVTTEIDAMLQESLRTYYASSAFEVSVGARGPQTDGEWLQYNWPQKQWYPAKFAGMHRNFRAGTLFWADFCDDPPPNLVDNLNGEKLETLLTEWRRIGDLARKHCCMCKDRPKISGSKEPYVHRYSWIFESAIRAGVSMSDSRFRTGGEWLTTMYRNYQFIHNYLEADGVTVKPGYDAKDVRGPADSCTDGTWWASFEACASCPLGTYKSGNGIILRGIVDYKKKEYKQFLRQEAWGAITACKLCGRGMVTMHTGSVSQDDCLCARGFTRSTADASKCVLCPRNFYKEAPGNDACTPCPAGLVSRAGATSAAQCTVPHELSTEYDEKYAYDSVLGLLSFARPVDPTWLDPAPYHTSNDRRCSLLDDDRSVSCPTRDYAEVFPKPVLSAGSNNQVLETHFKFGENLTHSPVINMQLSEGFTFWLPRMYRLTVHRHHAQGYHTEVDGQYRDDFSDTLHALEIYPGQSYEGPAPPGFVEEIFPGQAWPAHTVVNYRLRGRMTDLPHMFMVSFITNKRLNDDWTSNDYRFLLCAEWDTSQNHGWYLELCQDKVDPDNPVYRNQPNAHVLDGFVYHIGSQNTGSCFTENKKWWSKSCAHQMDEPMADRHFDFVQHWRPFSQTPPAPGPYYLYTTFQYLDTAACRYFRCVENLLYAQYPTFNALLQKRGDGWLRMFEHGKSLLLLPGSEITYGTPIDTMDPDEVDTSLPFSPVGGLLADTGPGKTEFYANGLLPSRVEEIPMPTRTDDTRACNVRSDATGIACTDGNSVQANLAGESTVLDGAEPNEHLKIVHDPACGSKPYTIDAACTLRPASTTSACMVDALTDGPVPADLPAVEPRYTKHDESRNWASVTEGATCTSTPLSAGSACANAQTSTATDNWPLPVLATDSYAYSSTVVQNDDGWEFNGAGGWCPDYATTVHAHLTLDLGSVQTVTGVAVQTRGFVCCYGQFFEAFAAETSEDGTTFTAAAWRGQEACPCVYRITRSFDNSDTLFAPDAMSNSIEVYRGANTTLSWNWPSATHEIHICAEIVSGGVCHRPFAGVQVDATRKLTHVYVPSDATVDVLFYYTPSSGDSGYNGVVRVVDAPAEEQVCAACPTAAAPGVVHGVAKSDPSTVNEYTVALFEQDISARYIRIRPEFREFGCLRVSALGPLLAPSATELTFAADQSSEAYLAVSLGTARTVQWVQVFVPQGTYHFDVLLGDDSANPLNNAMCATHTLDEPTPPLYRLRAARDIQGVGISLACVGVGSVVVLRLPVCENGNTDACNPAPLPAVRELRVHSPQSVFAQTSRWSWSYAERLGEVVTLAPGVSVYDPYSRPSLIPAAAAGVHAQSLAEVHQQWCGVRDHGELWLHLDLGQVRAVSGIQLQSLNRQMPWIRTTLRVRVVSSASAVFDEASAVVSGVLELNDASYAREDPEGATASFSMEPVLRARHLRFYPLDVHAACLRVGIVDCDLVCESACVNPAGVSAVQAEGGFALPSAGETRTLVHVPAADPAGYAEVSATFTALDPAKSNDGHTLQVSIPGTLAPGDRLFTPGSNDVIYTGAVDPTPFAYPPRESFADPAVLSPARLYHAQTPARSPFADSTTLPAAGEPDPTVHSMPAVDAGTSTGIVLQPAPGRVIGLHRTISAEDWRNTPVLRAQAEVGLTGARAPGSCQPPYFVQVTDQYAPSGSTLVVNGVHETAVLSDMNRGLVQVRKDILMHFLDVAVGGRPDVTCLPDLSNKPCIVRENDHLQPPAVGSGSTTFTEISTLQCSQSGHSKEKYMGCPAYVFDITALDPATGTSTEYTVRAHETQNYGWNLWRLVDNNLLNTDGTIYFGQDVLGQRLYGKDSFAGSGCTTEQLQKNAEPRATSVHMALVLTDRPLAGADWDRVFCGRLRGSIECDVGQVVDAGTGDCVPCTAETCAHFDKEYALCADGVDPDDSASTNSKPQGLLGGIVTPLGRGDPADPCSHVHPRVQVVAVDRKQHTGAADLCCTPDHPTATRLDLPGRIAYIPFSEGEALWSGRDETTLPVCTQTVAAPVPADFVPLDAEKSPLPCRTTARGAFPIAGDMHSAATIFTRAYVLGRGYVLLAVDAGDVVTHNGFRHRRIAEAFAVLTTDDASDFNGNLPNAPHVFTPGESVWSFHARTGGRSEQCPTDPMAVSRRGVVQFVVPAIDTAALPSAELHLYQLFLVGDSAACAANTACVEGAAPSPAPYAHVGEKLVLLPGTALWLEAGKAPPFAFEDGCLVVDFVGSTRDGQFFEVLPHAVPAHVGGQSFSSMDACSGSGSLPCAFVDAASGHTWYHVSLYMADGSSRHVALRTNGASDDPDDAGTVYVGYAVTGVGVATNLIDPAPLNLAIGDQMFLTSSRQCGGARRRRALLQARAIPSLRQAVARWQKAKTDLPTRPRVAPTAGMLVHREVIKARLDKKQRREHAVIASRHLLQTDTATAETSSTTTLRRTVIGADPVQSVLEATCAKELKMCALFEVDVKLPSALYCLSSQELIDRKQTELVGVFMRASNKKLSGVRVTSVYRPNFIAQCVQSTGARRLLATAGDATLDVVLSTDQQDVSIEIDNSDIVLSGIQRVHEQARHADGTRVLSLCVGDEACQKNATLEMKPVPTVGTTTTTSTPSSSETESSNNTVLFVVLISVVGALIVGSGVVVLMSLCRHRSKKPVYSPVHTAPCPPAVAAVPQTMPPMYAPPMQPIPQMW